MMKPIGRVNVPAAGTIVRVADSLPSSLRNVKVHGVLIQARYNNTGRIYIGDSTLVAATEVGCHCVLPIPTTNSIPSFSAALTISPAGIVFEDLWIDASVNGEGVVVSILLT